MTKLEELKEKVINYIYDGDRSKRYDKVKSREDIDALVLAAQNDVLDFIERILSKAGGSITCCDLMQHLPPTFLFEYRAKDGGIKGVAADTFRVVILLAAKELGIENE